MYISASVGVGKYRSYYYYCMDGGREEGRGEAGSVCMHVCMYVCMYMRIGPRREKRISVFLFFF
jgi:hypothetical protein